MGKSPEIRRILAVDFETASSQRASACSMGLCLLDFCTGELIEKQHYYINPEVEFSPKNIRIHGITPDIVSGSPTFPEVITELSSRLDNNTIVVSHNAPFDVSVILRSCIRYSISPPDFCYYCTLAFSKSLLPGLSSYTLDSVSDKLCLTPFQHHRADDDAEACAFIFFHLLRETDYRTIFTIDRKIKVRHKRSIEKYEEILKESHKATRIPSYHSSIDIPLQIFDRSSLPPSSETVISDYVLKQSPFFGMHVVFTGGLQTYTRSEASGAVLAAGGLVGENVVSFTDILVCGDGYCSHEPSVVLNRKMIKAKSYISKGKNISIIDESEFIQMLTDFEIIKENFSQCE